MKTILPLLMASTLILGACGNQTEDPSLDESTDTSIQSSVPNTDTSENASSEESADGNVDEADKAGKEEKDQHIAEVDEETGLHVVDNPESMQVYVNKQRTLPEGYEPPDLVVPDVAHRYEPGHMETHLREEAAHALEELFAGAAKEGLELMTISGYRSYDRQNTIYNNVVNAYGEEYADQYSAFPGTSEHQTGLGMDVRYKDDSKESKLHESFGETEHGIWLKEHAHEYGFIIRYPKGKEDITGYNYEPWHLRYVGQELAEELFTNDWTLEEYFGFDY